MTHDDLHLASRIAKIEYSSQVTLLPEYFRKLSKEDWGEWDDSLQNELSAVLKNNSLYPGPGVEAGSLDREGYFFCAIVDDEDLPWDVTQTDW
jgi:hypothetical protein